MSEPGRGDQATAHETQLVDEASAESFPASDPPAFTAGHVHDASLRETAPGQAQEVEDEGAERHDSKLVDDASKGSFPASDPPSFAAGHAHDDRLDR